VVAIADMSPGIVNFYFETKAALLIAALDYLAVEFEERVLVPLAALRHTPVVALRRLIELYLDPDIASARKVSVWYAFWGEANSRKEYYSICGKRDLAFSDLVQELIARLIAQTGLTQLNADAIALGLIGALEMTWQGIAFEDEEAFDRALAQRRCVAYLRSVFPGVFTATEESASVDHGPLPGWAYASANVVQAEIDGLFKKTWQFLALTHEIANAGDFLSTTIAGERILAVRDEAANLHLLRNLCNRRPHAVVYECAGHFENQIKCIADGARYGFDGSALDLGLSTLEKITFITMGDAVFALLSGTSASWPPAYLSPSSFAGIAQASPPATVSINCDWKIVIETWGDRYLSQTPPQQSSDAPLEKNAGLTIEMAIPQNAPNQAAASLQAYAQAIQQTHPTSGLNWQRHLVWPNLLVEMRADGITVLRVSPVSVGRCAIEIRHYLKSGNDRAYAAASYLARRVWREWIKEDLQICQSMQPVIANANAPLSKDYAGEAGEFWRWLRLNLANLYDTRP